MDKKDALLHELARLEAAAPLSARETARYLDIEHRLSTLDAASIHSPHNACCYREQCKALESRALAAEAALAAALEALGPFADEKNATMQDLLWGDQPDSATMTITCPLGQVRKARQVVRAAAIRAGE